MKIDHEFLTLSLRNRFSFLEGKKLEWLNCESERKRKKLIVELIQLEPSHLAEDWVLDQIIKWMKDRQKNLEYLKASFVAKGIRDELTENQRDNLAKASFLDHKVKKKSVDEGSKIGAIRKIVLNSDESIPEEAELAIKQKLKRYKKSLDSRTLPYPYYGKDIVEVDRGNENHRLELYLKNKPVECNGRALFGNTTYTIPLKKTE